VSASSFSPRSRLALWLCGFALLCGAPSLSWCQDSSPSFDPAKVYQVTGAQLNRLNEDLQTAKKALADSQAQNEQLQRDSDSKQKALDALQAQLQTASLSLKRYEDRTVADEWKIGVVSFLAGAAIVEAAQAFKK
jgi:septal ring factor EnvC (AmiA/AmiB activator)